MINSGNSAFFGEAPPINTQGESINTGTGINSGYGSPIPASDHMPVFRTAKDVDEFNEKVKAEDAERS
jgi:hypothetical protein